MDPSEDEGHSPPLQDHPFRLNASSPLPFLLKGFITKTELGSHRACYNEVLGEMIGHWIQRSYKLGGGRQRGRGENEYPVKDQKPDVDVFVSIAAELSTQTTA